MSLRDERAAFDQPAPASITGCARVKLLAASAAEMSLEMRLLLRRQSLRHAETLGTPQAAAQRAEKAEE